MAALPLLGFDPLEMLMQILTVVFIGLLLWFVWRHQDRVCEVLTGDDRVHCTFIDIIWTGFFNCCGTCTGDWTRHFTRPCLCLPGKYRGVNIIKLVGQCLGFSTIPIELKNIVLGDLPRDRRCDFYISIESHQNPPMVTSVAEEKHPKVVHFPEVLTLRLCRSLLEQAVTIRVFELDAFGSTELCNCHVSAMHLLDWSDDPHEKVKRIMMKPCEAGIERETPSWILVEVDQPHDLRELDAFHGHNDTVRTTTQGDGHYDDVKISDFKHTYTLLDANGHAIQEPLEEDLEELQCLSRWFSRIDHFVMFLLVWFCVIYITFRTYVWSCYRQFRWVTMAAMHHYSFPMSTQQLQTMVRNCTTQFEGTGLTGIPCNPNEEQVMGYCTHDDEGGQFPHEQHKPIAFSVLLHNTLGVDKQGLGCYYGVCSMRDDMVKYDVYILPGVVLVGIVGCLMRIARNKCIRRRRRQQQADQHRETHEMQRKMKEKKSAWRIGSTSG
eukprot:CAMPEP_0195115602 /NCGR_PEP_ID=MMETSP0448-20130528/109531_1 /TAXON_ID=66468 /ORGANISM="Heterocapsa triquestra, Strain CCMP 448" /LENGTH=493 /DNA_ID=CAMNT_0040152723 /DNA_START=95 /DNA_END=1572 /DNA_ORIENTATION=-